LPNSPTPDETEQQLKHPGKGLEHISIILNHLTVFSRSLARRGPRSGPADHKWPVTQFNGCEKAAFGGPNQSVGVVEQLARCTASCGPVRLANGLILHHQMIQYNRNVL
jgi:hypothetical protein